MPSQCQPTKHISSPFASHAHLSPHSPTWTCRPAHPSQHPVGFFGSYFSPSSPSSLSLSPSSASSRLTSSFLIFTTPVLSGLSPSCCWSGGAVASAGAKAFLKPPFLKPDFESGPPDIGGDGKLVQVVGRGNATLTDRFNSNGTDRRPRLFIGAGFSFECTGAGRWVFGELLHFFEALGRASVASQLCLVTSTPEPEHEKTRARN